MKNLSPSEMESADSPLVQQHTATDNTQAKWRQLLLLPDDANVSVLEPQVGSLSGSQTVISIDGRSIVKFRPLPREVALIVSAVNTPFEKENTVPRFPVLELSPVTGSNIRAISIANFWACIYGLWTLLHTREYIPIVLSHSFANADDLEHYLLYSGLGRKALDAEIVDEIFLDRGTFWSGAGVGSAWGVERGWMCDSLYAERAASFPLTHSFTRTSTVITQHPLRPPKPALGSCIYRRFCTTVGKTLTFHVFDPEDPLHMNAFHEWQNSERVAKGWNERGSMEHHRQYIQGVTDDPGTLPFLMSWDDELMGYGEFVWTKENHVAPYIPGGAWDYDRGVHVLVGEEKFRGRAYSQAWFRSATHYMFLADPRTQRIICEPKRSNPAILRVMSDASMHVETSFYFPYKQSALTMNLRERFFKEDMLL